MNKGWELGKSGSANPFRKNYKNNLLKAHYSQTCENTKKKPVRAEKTILTFTYKGNTICMLPDLAETMEPKKQWEASLKY